MWLGNRFLFSSLLLTLLVSSSGTVAEGIGPSDYDRSRWHPIHHKPVIDNVIDDQCLSCHQEILERNVLDRSPAGVKSSEVLAWYQTLTTYEGEQDTFHRRHLVTPLAKELMDLRCNTCHQGNDLREEAPVPPDHSNRDMTLRKSVNPDVCLMCHGANPYKLMGLPKPWAESRDMFQGNCLLCHAHIRTTRHQVNFLKADAIEEAAKIDPDVCYGCHGGRQWYRIGYPYPRHAWKGMSNVVPDWAKGRPTESEPRFQIKTQQAAK
ncbi:MAG: hypothetical protein KZQ93_19175 [Candidatus Thiodiazotropha sp. (ex Monitilora ramsayi)]|nr:hypothetical protein [Candidatus Thiodiazotropha sp. (ex Monitilora ramsayi)]